MWPATKKRLWVLCKVLDISVRFSTKFGFLQSFLIKSFNINLRANPSGGSSADVSEQTDRPDKGTGFDVILTVHRR